LSFITVNDINILFLSKVNPSDAANKDIIVNGITTITPLAMYRCEWEAEMDIIFQGRHSEHEICKSLYTVLEMLKNRYQIAGFREMHFSLTLVDATGGEVELIDSETNQPYRLIEVHRDSLKTERRIGRPSLTLIVDNTK
jgi:hypothetical protein